jgi:adenylate cyclase class 2
MQASEIELKFPVADPSAFQSMLPALGFHLDTSRTFESNTLYDTPGRDLRARKQLLRIRQYGSLWTVTHKRPSDLSEPSSPLGNPPAGPTAKYKVRVETETHVDDGEATAEIFANLGYLPVFRYEKYRTEWSQMPLFAAERPDGAIGHLVVDETPIGNYAELEGPTDWIDSMLELLGIDALSCLTDSYGKLFLDWKERTGSPVENLTFSEIAAAPVLTAI